MAKQKSQNDSPGQISTADLVAARPEVIVEFLFDHGLLYISVNNIGSRPALSVSVRFNKKILGLGGARDISALAIFKNIEFLGPHREITSLLDSSSSYFKRKQPTKISALITYQDLEKRQYETSIKHDLEIYRDLVFVEPKADLANQK
jgi:hypothetical protein